LKCLKSLGKDDKLKLKYIKWYFDQDISESLILNYKFIKFEYKLSNQLEDDYIFIYYSDISAFISKF
jgi:hypothetical protein